MGAKDPTAAAPWESGQIIAWVLALFALTGLGALPLLLQGLSLNGISGATPHMALILLGMLMISCSPTLAALLVVEFYPRAGGIHSIACQVRTWRVAVFWYAIAIPGPFLLLLAAEGFDAWLLGRAPLHWLTWPSFSGPGGLYLVIFGSLLAEEPGWRGFAQPRLQTRYGALTASVFIGLLWSTWHLWYVILPDGFSNVTAADAIATYVRLTATAVLYAWMYNSTNGSLLIAMLAHTGHNLAASFMPAPPQSTQLLINAIAYLLVATLVVLVTDWRTLRWPKTTDPQGPL